MVRPWSIATATLAQAGSEIHGLRKMVRERTMPIDAGRALEGRLVYVLAKMIKTYGVKRVNVLYAEAKGEAGLSLALDA